MFFLGTLCNFFITWLMNTDCKLQRNWLFPYST
ncbi:hypothetical protein Nmel_000211 [Mimus melanotis]